MPVKSLMEAYWTEPQSQGNARNENFASRFYKTFWCSLEFLYLDGMTGYAAQDYEGVTRVIDSYCSSKGAPLEEPTR